MFKNLIQFYSMAICLVSSIILMFTISLMISAATDLTLGKYKRYSDLDHFSTNEKYITYNQVNNKPFNDTNPETITEHRLSAKKYSMEELKNQSIKQLIDYSSWGLTAVLFFLIHWKLYQRQEK